MGKRDPQAIAPANLSRIADLPLADDPLEMKRLARLDACDQGIVAAMTGGGEADSVAGAMRSYEEGYTKARERDSGCRVKRLQS